MNTASETTTLSSISFVSGPSELARLVDSIGSLDPEIPIALDTEADSFHHYHEKVCLLQLAWDGQAFLVDPLADIPLKSLLSVLSRRPLLLHGADYDLRLLYRGHGFRASRVFETMLAAQLLGEREVGLASLLSRRLGVTLDKAFQRADWSLRPLEPGMLAYAASDVLHLPALAAQLSEELTRKGRLPWHEEECRRLVVGDFTPPADDREKDWRLKGTNALTGQERAFVRELYWAREERAAEIDRPPFRVLTNERLIEGARRAARGESALEQLFPGKPLPTALARRVRAALEAARKLGPEEWPLPRRGERAETDPQIERAVEALKKRRDARAQALGVEPGVLISRAALTSAARVLQNASLTAEELASATGLSLWRAEMIVGK